METVNYEWDIQKFISDYPWLINLNYQNVPELKDNYADIEHHVEGNKRLDLILRDSLTGFPVIVEFKRGDLNRDTIGQILEYKSRIITSLNNEENILYKIFGNKIVSPKMVIIVRTSDIYGKIACHLQNIDLIEYGSIESKMITGEIELRKSVEEFTKTLETITPHMNLERTEYLENNVYSVFFDLFKQYKIEHQWIKYRNCDKGNYWDYDGLFLNKWFLKDQEISIGLYEDLHHEFDLSVWISYHSKNKEKLNELHTLLSSEKDNNFYEFKEFPGDPGYYMYNFRYASNVFYKDVKQILELNLKSYLKVNQIQ